MRSGVTAGQTTVGEQEPKNAANVNVQKIRPLICMYHTEKAGERGREGEREKKSERQSK